MSNEKIWQDFDNGCVKGIEYKDGQFRIGINERGKSDNSFYGHITFTIKGEFAGMTTKYIYENDLEEAKKIMLKYLPIYKKEMLKLKVVDRRKDGFYCQSCHKFLPKCQMGWGLKYIHHEPGKIWWCKTHYDGCFGWD